MAYLDYDGLEYFKGKQDALIAEPYSTSATYSVGEYVTHDGLYYRCTTAITTAEAWTAAHWTQVVIGDEISDIKEDITDIDAELENKANIDGYYENMTVGNAEQLVATVGIEDEAPYNFRTAGGTADIGDRETDMVVGGTVAWNQLVTTDTNVSKTKSGDIVTVTDAINSFAQEIVISVDAQQDLNGYDRPWPGGVGVNKLNIFTCIAGYNAYGLITSIDSDGFVKADGEINVSNSSLSFAVISVSTAQKTELAGKGFVISILDVSGGTITSSWGLRTENESSIAINLSNPGIGETVHLKFRIVVATSAVTSFSPYANICPIIGFTEANVRRTGNNLFNSTIGRYVWSASDGNRYNNGSGAYCGSADKIPVKGGSTITVSFNNTGTTSSVSCNWYKNGTFVSRNGAYSPPYSFSVPDGIDECAISIANTSEYSGEATVSDVIVSIGTTAEPYEPYSGTTVNVDWETEAGTVYGGTAATVSGNGTSTKASVDLGTLTWYKASNNIDIFYTLSLAGANYPSAMLCSQYPFGGVTTSNQGAYNFGDCKVSVYNGPDYRVYVRDDRYASLTGDEFADVMSGVQLVYTLVEPVDFTFAPSNLTLLEGENNVWNNAGSTSLTYLGTTNEITALTGRKYLTKINGVSTVVNGSGQVLTGEKGRDNIFDLTQMLGSTIADYIYAIESGNAGDGVAWFAKLFPKSYYNYNSGELMSVNVSEHNMIGFNAWDEVWEVGGIYNTTGLNYTASDRIRAKNYIPCVPSAQYYVLDPTNGNNIDVVFYDADKKYISGTGWTMGAITTPSNCHFMRFMTSGVYGATYRNNICINLSWDGERDGEYEPYELHSYALDSTLTLRGIPKFDSGNNLYYDGDTYESDGTVTRKYGVVDMGTLDWGLYTHDGKRCYLAPLSNAGIAGTNIIPDILCQKYAVVTASASTNSLLSKGDNIISTNTDNKVFVWDTHNYEDRFAFTAAVSGVYLIYKIATPTTESADPYQNPQIVNDFGTEEYVDYAFEHSQRDVEIPVGHVTTYAANLRAKLEMAPDSPSDGDGDYIVRQSSGENEYVKLASISNIFNLSYEVVT